LKELRKEIDEALQHLDDGDVIDFDDERTHAALLEDIKANDRRHLAREQSERCLHTPSAAQRDVTSMPSGTRLPSTITPPGDHMS
jgi:hypothetical protein